MLKSCCLDWLQRFPLFPGKYCYPLSPPNEATSNMKCKYKLILSLVPTWKKRSATDDIDCPWEAIIRRYELSIRGLGKELCKKFVSS